MELMKAPKGLEADRAAKPEHKPYRDPGTPPAPPKEPSRRAKEPFKERVQLALAPGLLFEAQSAAQEAEVTLSAWIRDAMRQKLTPR